jgi:hypothetical protein
MDRFAKLQFVGPATLFAAVLLGEGAAYALELYPASPQLWFINLACFGVLQRSFYAFSGVIDIAYFQLLYIALPVFLLACCGLFLRRRLILAVASNLSLAFACFLIGSWWAFEPTTQEVSLTVIGLPTQPDFYLAIVLLASSLLSGVMSHIAYLRVLRINR